MIEAPFLSSLANLDRYALCRYASQAVEALAVEGQDADPAAIVLRNVDHIVVVVAIASEFPTSSMRVKFNDRFFAVAQRVGLPSL